MFDQDEIKAYRGIQAPENLRDSICGMDTEADIAKKSRIPRWKKRETMNRWIRPLSTLAACLAVALMGTFLLGQIHSSPEVYVNGERLAGEPILLEVSADTPDTASQLQRTRSTGLVIAFEVADEEWTLKEDQDCVVQEDATHFLWEIMDADVNQTYGLILEDDQKHYEMVLQFDEESSQWTLHLEQRS